MFQRINTKDTVIGLLVIVSVAAIGFSSWTLNKDYREKWHNRVSEAQGRGQQEGYASALQQLVAASEDPKNNGQVAVTVGDRTVNFIMVTEATRPEPSSTTAP